MGRGGGVQSMHLPTSVAKGTRGGGGVQSMHLPTSVAKGTRGGGDLSLRIGKVKKGDGR